MENSSIQAPCRRSLVVLDLRPDRAKKAFVLGADVACVDLGDSVAVSWLQEKGRSLPHGRVADCRRKNCFRAQERNPSSSTCAEQANLIEHKLKWKWTLLRQFCFGVVSLSVSRAGNRILLCLPSFLA